MAYKVNYGLERAERNRLKQAKKEAKQKSRKMDGEAESPADPATLEPPAPPEQPD